MLRKIAVKVPISQYLKTEVTFYIMFSNTANHW